MATAFFFRPVTRFASPAKIRKNLDPLMRRAKASYELSRAPLGWQIAVEVSEKRLLELGQELAAKFSPAWNPVEGLSANEEGENAPPVAVGDINRNFAPDTFNRLFGLEAQIRRVLDPIDLGVDTKWQKRRHTLLCGPPGCGKTDLMLTLSRALGKEGEAWVWYDATSTTRAGAVEQLMKAKAVPPILFVEEIEKTSEASLRWLLGVMDDRGELRRTNYRVGNQSKAIRLLVIATANSLPVLAKMDSGALLSRFSNQIYCPKPSPEVAKQILLREVKDIGGKEKWVDEVLPYYTGEIAQGKRVNEHSIRECISLLLCGRDRLLDGSFHRDYKATQLKREYWQWD